MLDSPGHLAIPQFDHSAETALFPIWNLFYDQTDRQYILHGLEEYGMDDMMYKSTLLECQYHVRLLSQEVEAIDYDTIKPDGINTDKITETHTRLHAIRNVVRRLKICILENCATEEKLRRASSVNATSFTAPPRDSFTSLATTFKELESSLLQRFALLQIVVDIQSKLRMLEQGRALQEKSQSVSRLMQLSFLCTLLCLVAVVFGMQLR